VFEGDVCFAPLAADAAPSRRTVVIFLHGLLDDGAGWQLGMQRGMAAAGRRLGFSVLAPRGRNGLGPGRRVDQVGWPTSEALRAEHEDAMLAKIDRARLAAEASQGAPFDEVFLMGFSNGAYYAASLALRGRLLDVDGYALFAGGSAATRPSASGKARKPMFLGIASKDRTTVKSGRELARALRKLRWPSRAVEAPVGHTVADKHLSGSIRWLRQQVGDPVNPAPPDAGTSAQAPPEAPAPPQAPPPAAKPKPKPKPKPGPRQPRH
jgi:predicted esterase